MQPKLWEQVPPHRWNCFRPIGGTHPARQAEAPPAWRRLRYRRGVSSRVTVNPCLWWPRTALRSGFWCRADMTGYKPDTAADTAALYPDTAGYKPDMAADTAALYPATAAAVAGYKPDIALKCPILICLSAKFDSQSFCTMQSRPPAV